MEIFASLIAFCSAILPFLIALTIIVFVHELGHFLIARYNGVGVATFSIGYGPELFGWTDKKGTRWRFSLLPIGGYVMMLGDADATSVRSDTSGLTDEQQTQSLTSKSPLQRMAVASGGPLMNILFTLIVFICLGLWKGVPEMQPRIDSVSAGSPAESAGLVAGDLITHINNHPTPNTRQLREFLKKHQGQNIVITYLRGKESHDAGVALYTKLANGVKMPVCMLGVALQGELIFTPTSCLGAISYGINYCWAVTTTMVSGLGKAITGQSGGAKLGSLISIGDVAHSSMSAGLLAFVNFMAMLSFSLAIFNLLPIPVLDGGTIALTCVELVRGRALSERTVNIVYTIGLATVAGLMLWAMWNDLVRYHVVEKGLKTVRAWLH